MKKSILLLIMLMLLTMSGVTKQSLTEVVDTQQRISLANPLNTETETIMPFDTYRQLQQIKAWGNLFGRATVNTDFDYITQGNGSMHVEIMGDYTSVNAYPFFIIDCEKDGVTTKNFSKYEYICLDVYNDTDKVLNIKLHISVYGTSGKIEDTPSQDVELQPNSWTNARYDLSDGSVRRGFNNLSNVAGVVVQFMEYSTSKNDTPNSLYIDNLAGKRVASPADYNPSRQANEMLFFENDGDMNFFNTDAMCLNVIYNADLSINTNSAFVSQGAKSLKCVFKYRYIYFDYFVQSKDLWIPLNINVRAFSNCKRITFDIFNASGKTKTFKVKYSYKSGFFGLSTTEKEDTYSAANGAMTTVEVIAEKPTISSEQFLSLMILTKVDEGSTDIYYIDNIKYFT